MTDSLAWLSPAFVRTLAWVLLHFLWQGLVLAAVFTTLATTMRSAAGRYSLAVSVLALMLAAPFATFFYLQAADSGQANSLTPPSAQVAVQPLHDSASHASSSGSLSPDTFTWLVRIWIAGVVVFSLRTAGGLLIVERLRHRKATPVAERLLQTCLNLQRRVGIKRAIRFCQCNGLDVPAVVGWFRPVVLLPMTALTGLSQAQLEAVIVHELAHIRRWDYFVNLFQITVETLLFYHPAVWWVSYRIRLERENCCDDMAVQLCGDVVDYARALTFLEGGRTAPSLALAASGSPLTMRVMRLLGQRKSGGRILSFGIAFGALCLATGIFLSQSFVRVAHADLRPDSQPKAAVAATPANAVVTLKSPTRAVLPDAEPVAHLAQLATPATPPALPAPAAIPQPPTAPAIQAKSGEQAAESESYIDSLKSVGLDHLSVDDVVAMKVQGVTADYVRELQGLGLKTTPDDLIAMRVQGISPQYLRELEAAGIHANADDLVAMKIQGVTPEYVRSLQQLGLKTTADDLVAMRIQRVTPEYVREIRGLGLNPTADDLFAMQIQGVTPDYVRALSAAGVAKSDVDDYIAAKIQGITPEFLEKARQHGFHNLTLDQLIELKRAGIL